MSTLFRSRFLIFKMNTRSTRFDKELDELHDCTQSSMSGITIGHNGSEIIHEWSRLLTVKECLGTFIVLTTVMMKLGAYQLIHLVGYCIHGIIGKVGSRFIGSTGGRRTLPSGYIDTGQVGCHLNGLDGIEGAKGMRVAANVVKRRQHGIQAIRRFTGITALWRLSMSTTSF